MKRATFQLSAGQKIDGGVLIAIHGDAGRIHFQVAMCEGHADCYWVLLHRCLRRESRLNQLSQAIERVAFQAGMSMRFAVSIKRTVVLTVVLGLLVSV